MADSGRTPLQEAGEFIDYGIDSVAGAVGIHTHFAANDEATQDPALSAINDNPRRTADLNADLNAAEDRTLAEQAAQAKAGADKGFAWVKGAAIFAGVGLALIAVIEVVSLVRTFR